MESHKMTKAEKQRFQRMVDLGCIICLRGGWGHSQPEIHHIRKGQGVGQRASHDKTIPLCPAHHRTGGYGVAIHAGQKAFENKFGDEHFLLEYTNQLIGA
jgi:hypothetical protein